MAATAGDSVYTRVFDLLDVKTWGTPAWPDPIAARVIRNATVEQWQGREDKLAADIDDASVEFKQHLERDEMRWRPIYAGPAAGVVHSIRPAADVVREICESAEIILQQRVGELIA